LIKPVPLFFHGSNLAHSRQLIQSRTRMLWENGLTAPNIQTNKDGWVRGDKRFSKRPKRELKLVKLINNALNRNWGQWTVLQLSWTMIIYNSTWSILIQWIRVMIGRWQCDLENRRCNTITPYIENSNFSGETKNCI